MAPLKASEEPEEDEKDTGEERQMDDFTPANSVPFGVVITDVETRKSVNTKKKQYNSARSLPRFLELLSMGSSHFKAHAHGALRLLTRKARQEEAERPLLVREKRWSTDYLSRLSSSLDTIGTENFMPKWPQEVVELVELLKRPGDSALYATMKDASSEQLKFQSGAYCISHPEKSEKAIPGGADSYFAAENDLSLGVADGVGEWEWRFGINPRAFADELMNGCQDHLKDMTGMESLPRFGQSQHALKALQNGWEGTKSFGSSTGLVATLNRSGHLGVANLGDSALLLLRRNEVDPTNTFRCVARTREQQHYFNCPYQLAVVPKRADFPALLDQGKEKFVRAIERCENIKTDCVNDADLFDFNVQEGDLLVLGTDGVFDNLYVEEVCELASAAIGPRQADCSHITEAEQIAHLIAKAAFHRSLNPSARSPFSDHATQAGICHAGGKMDDITCVCAWILSTDLRRPNPEIVKLIDGN